LSGPPNHFSKRTRLPALREYERGYLSSEIGWNHVFCVPLTLCQRGFFVFIVGGKRMEKLIIALPDGAEKEIGKGTIALDIAREISPSLAKKAVAAKLNDTIIDLSQPLEESGQLQ